MSAGTILDTVVLVHGLWGHGVTMALMRRRIARAGARVLLYSYPTMRLTLAENAQRLARYCREVSAARLHFVGHSLGGLVVLRMLGLAATIPVGRIVLAGVPFAGSYSALRLARMPGGRTALGRSMAEWLDGGARDAGSGCEVGVIAGSLPVGLGRLVAPGLPGPSDGVVSVEETRFPGMRDHIVLPVSHSAMLVSGSVVRQVCAFLRDGAFARAGDR